MKLQAGVGRTRLTPFWGVELTGWGYYIERTWQEVHDHLNATSLVIANDTSVFAILSLDLMVISAEFTAEVRQLAAAATDIPPHHIMVTCTHSHNTPASGGLLGVGEVDAFYEHWAAKQAATSVIDAWRNQQAAACFSSVTNVDDLTFNRTRENGPVDSTLTTLRVDSKGGAPLAFVVGYQGHPTVTSTLRPRAVSRDVPGQICDYFEAKYPTCKAMYIQGACGDVNFLREFATPEKEDVPARILSVRAMNSLNHRQPLAPNAIGCHAKMIDLPTRRWTPAEIDRDRNEAEQRLRDHDVTGWRESIGRYMVNRPDDMVTRHGGDEWKAVAAMCRFNMEWTNRILEDLETRPEFLSTEIQALRIGDFGIVSNSTEFFTLFSLAIRKAVTVPHLMLACYTNGRIGYLPDEYDIDRKSYASVQSPKYCNQFPFTVESGHVMVREMVALMNSLHG